MATNGVQVWGMYGPSASEFVVPCAIAAGSTSVMTCATAPGVGSGFQWTINVATQISAPSAATTSYVPPVFRPPPSVTGPGVVNGSTAGNQQVQILASGIGPLTLPSTVYASYVVTYGATGKVGRSSRLRGPVSERGLRVAVY